MVAAAPIALYFTRVPTAYAAMIRTSPSPRLPKMAAKLRDSSTAGGRLEAVVITPVNNCRRPVAGRRKRDEDFNRGPTRRERESTAAARW